MTVARASFVSYERLGIGYLEIIANGDAWSYGKTASKEHVTDYTCVKVFLGADIYLQVAAIVARSQKHIKREAAVEYPLVADGHTRPNRFVCSAIVTAFFVLFLRSQFKTPDTAIACHIGAHRRYLVFGEIIPDLRREAIAPELNVRNRNACNRSAQLCTQVIGNGIFQESGTREGKSTQRVYFYNSPLWLLGLRLGLLSRYRKKRCSGNG